MNENVKPTSSSLATGDAEACAWRWHRRAGPVASAMSHQTNSRNPTVAAQPVIRCRIDSDIVYMNLYTPRWGDSGRWFIVPLEIDAAAVFFPVAETRGLRALRAAEFGGSRRALPLHGIRSGRPRRR